MHCHSSGSSSRTDKEETDPASWTEVFFALRFLISVLLGATSGCRKREAVLSFKKRQQRSGQAHSLDPFITTKEFGKY